MSVVRRASTFCAAQARAGSRAWTSAGSWERKYVMRPARSRASRRARTWATPSSIASDRAGEKPLHEAGRTKATFRSEEHTSELQSRFDLVCRLLLEKKNKNK